MRFASGTPIAGRYLLLDELTAGRQTAVWRGMDDVLGRPVAVKFYLGTDADARAWIHTRARTAARLTHPHATAVYDFGDASGADGTLTPYVVMEFLDGESLADRLASARTLPWPRAARVAAEVAGALAAGHARRVVHGNVSPAAVMLTPTGAKLLGLPDPRRPTPVTAESVDDVHDVGLLLLRALCGTAARAASAAQSLAQVPDLPTEVGAVCLACLSSSPRARPTMAEAARELATEVNRYAAEQPEDAATPLVPMPALGSPATAPEHSGVGRSGRVQAGLAAAGVLAVLVASGVAVRYGDDLLAAATGTPGTAASSSARAGRAPNHVPVRSSGSGPQEGSTGAAGAGTSPSPGPSGTTMSPGPAGSPTPLPSDIAAALAQLRESVDDGRTTNEIKPDVAAQLDEAIDDVDRQLSTGQKLEDRIARLHDRVDRLVATGKITADRGADLHAKLDALAAVVPPMSR
jgi:serine/threonine-protein kinase